MVPTVNTAIDAAVADHVHWTLKSNPLMPAYGASLVAVLTVPGRVLSEIPILRWTRTISTCCLAAGGQSEQAVPVSAAVELFMVALELLDDEEDGEDSPMRADLGPARLLNVSTGLLLVAQHSLLRADGGAAASDILLGRALRSCAGQDADLTPETEWGMSLEGALTVTEWKSSSLVAAACELGAFCAAAHPSAQALYAQFGGYLGMVAQLRNDLAGIAPGAAKKTDVALHRPTLPLVLAARSPSALAARDDEGESRAALWTRGPAHLTWAVAEAYRHRALALIPRLTTDPAHQAALADLTSVP